MKFSSEKPTLPIILRSVRISDAAFLLRMENDPEVWTYGSQADAPYTFDQIVQFCCAMQSAGALPDPSGQLRLIIDCDGQAVGTIDFYNYCKESYSSSIAIIIYPAAERGQHFGSYALNQAIALAHSIGIERLTAEIAPSNQPSRHLFAGCGFTQQSITHSGTLLYRLSTTDFA